jgi:protein TonB
MNARDALQAFRKEAFVFESALGRSEAASGRLGTGAILSGGVHALVAALVFIIPGKTKAQQDEAPPPVMVEFVTPRAASGGSPGPAEPAAKAASPAISKPAPVRIADQPTPTPVADEPEPPAPSSAGPTGDDNAPAATPGGGGEGGGNGGGSGVPGGSGNGPGITPPEPKPIDTVINWNGKMERPALISGPPRPTYPRNAMLQHREGTVITRCRITTNGFVRDCSIISGDVMLQQASLDALAQQHYRPLMYEGVPVSVWYTFRFTFKLQ